MSGPADPPADTLSSVARGGLGRCPRCGEGRLFGRFLKVRPTCSGCGLRFDHHRADDFPPYVVMFIVGHIVGYGIYVAEMRFADVPVWFHAALWPSLAIGLSLVLLQPVKGAVVGLQYGLGMHGFGAERMRGSGPEQHGRREDELARRENGAADRLRERRQPREALAEPDA